MTGESVGIYITTPTCTTPTQSPESLPPLPPISLASTTLLICILMPQEDQVFLILQIVKIANASRKVPH